MSAETNETPRERVYAAAKELIWKKGFKNTTMEQIAKLSGIPKGSVTYYYKKEDFITQIYLDFSNRLLQRISDTVGDRLENAFQRHLIFVRLFFYVVFRDPNSKALYRENVFDGIIPDYSPYHTLVRTPLMKYIMDLKLDISPITIEWVMEAELSARRRLIALRFDKLDPYKSTAFLDFTSTISIRLTGVSSELVDENVKKAGELIKEIPYDDLQFIEFN